jgi:UDP-N-acetylmuramate-alanine ligase
LRALGGEVDYVDDVERLPERVLAVAPEGALVLFLGAGSITSAAAALAEQLERPPVPR